MAHLRNFSHENHSLYIHDRSIFYDANGIAQPLQFNDNGTIRRYDLYTDLPNPNINFPGSGFTSASFPPVRYNDNPNIVNNILNEFDFTGVSIRNYRAARYSNFGILNPNLYGNSGLLNPDESNSDNYPMVLITPRHAVISAHPVNFCNQGAQALDPENFSSCCCETCDCREDEIPAFYQWIYINSKWMGKNNQIVNPFQNITLQELVAAFRAKNYNIAPRIRNLVSLGSGIDAFILEYPSDIATPENQVTYYPNLTDQTLLNFDETVYTITGSLNAIKLKRGNLENGLIFVQYDDNYYRLDTNNPPFVFPSWLGDSSSPRFIKRNNQQVFIGMLSGLTTNTTSYTEIVKFIDNGPTNYSNLLRFGIEEGSELSVNYTKYFGTAPSYSPLGGSTYGSRFTDNERNTRNYSQIAFAPGNALQASELNEMQENFHKNMTLRNTFLSHLAVENFNGRSSIFKQSLPRELQLFRLGNGNRGTWSEGPYSPEMNNGEYGLYSYDSEGSLLALPNIEKSLCWLKNSGQGLRGFISPFLDITQNDYSVDWTGRLTQFDQTTSVVIGFFATHAADFEGYDPITDSNGSFEKLVGFYNNRTTNKWVAAIYRRSTPNGPFYLPFFEFETNAAINQTNNLKVIITNGGTTAKYYVNDVLVAQTSGNLPDPGDVVNSNGRVGARMLMGLHMRRFSQDTSTFTVSGTLRTNRFEGKIFRVNTLNNTEFKQYALPEKEIENTLLYDARVGYDSNIEIRGWLMFKHKSGLHYFNYSTYLMTSILDQQNTFLDTTDRFISYKLDSNLNDPISNFYGASRLSFLLDPEGILTYYVQNINNTMYTVDGRRFTNRVE